MNKKAPDWIIHCIGGECTCDKCGERNDEAGFDGIVYHTHGLAQYNNGLELELNLDIAPNSGSMILNTIGFALRDDNFIIKDGAVDNTLFSMPIRFNKFQGSIDGDFDEVMRVVLCDKNGFFPDDERCDLGYKEQMCFYKRH